MTVAELNTMLAGDLPDAPVDHWGRRLIVPPAGGKAKPYTRVTTFIKAITESGNDGLINFHGRYVARGLVDDPVLMQFVLDHDPDDPAVKQELNRRLEQAAHQAGKNHKRDLGTAIHDACARTLAGLPVAPHPDIDGPLRQFLHLVDSHNITVVASEQIVVHERYGVSGRFDLAMTVGNDPTVGIGDIKTGDFDMGIAGYSPQLYIYATADTIYDPVAETHQPMIPVADTHGWIIHLPRNGDPATLHRVDHTGTREMCDLAVAKRAWRTKAKKHIAKIVPSAPPSRHDWILDRLKHLADIHTPERIRTEWADHIGEQVPTPRQLNGATWTDEHIDLIAGYCDKVEAGHNLPFGPSDPNIQRPQLPADTFTPRETLTPAAEGEQVADDKFEPIIERLNRDTWLKSLISRWATDAHRDKVAWTPGTGHFTRRRLAITAAAVAAADKFHDYDLGDETITRAAIDTVTGNSRPDLYVGTLLGLLTIEQAEQLAALANTATLRITDTGEIRFDHNTNT